MSGGAGHDGGGHPAGLDAGHDEHSRTGSANVWRARRCATPPSSDDRAEAVRLLRVLRPALDEHAASVFVEEASATGYTLMLLDDADGVAAALAGWRTLPTSRGRVLFLEDLVVDPARRHRGAARALLGRVAAEARATGCVRVELDTGVGNTSAQALYDGAGLSRVAVHYGLVV